MLSIQQVNFYKKLVEQGEESFLECPFDRSSEKHTIISKVDKEYNVYFKCLDCDTNFKLGINGENKIIKAIEKYLNKK